MDPLFRMRKRVIREYLRLRYTDNDLVKALDHARTGLLSFNSCCCFVGLRNADHPRGVLMGEMPLAEVIHSHYALSKSDPIDSNAEIAFKYLGDRYCGLLGPQNNPIRRRILIPMLLAEIRRRAKEISRENFPVTATNVR